MTRCLRISRFLALIGSVLTLVQICLLLLGDSGICLNDGCKIVDSLIKVSPILFNLAGFIFFQIIFWWFKFLEKEGLSLSLARWVLLGALAAEGVLVSFQHFVVNIYCSYCLIVFGLVVLLNILAGVRQIVSGIAVFLAMLIAFSCLQFAGAGGDLVTRMDEGTFARLPGQEDRIARYLFFSSTCSHCEEVIKGLADVDCAVSLNPVDSVDDIVIAGAQKTDNYNSALNSRLLKSLGINQVPTLLVKSHSEYRILTGTDAIEEYFETYQKNECVQEQQNQLPEQNSAAPPAKDDTHSESDDNSVNGSSSMSDPGLGLDSLTSSHQSSQAEDDTCTVGQECD